MRQSSGMPLPIMEDGRTSMQSTVKRSVNTLDTTKKLTKKFTLQNKVQTSFLMALTVQSGLGLGLGELSSLMFLITVFFILLVSGRRIRVSLNVAMPSYAKVYA